MQRFILVLLFALRGAKAAPTTTEGFNRAFPTTAEASNQSVAAESATITTAAVPSLVSAGSIARRGRLGKQTTYTVLTRSSNPFPDDQDLTPKGLRPVALTSDSKGGGLIELCPAVTSQKGGCKPPNDGYKIPMVKGGGSVLTIFNKYRALYKVPSLT